MRFPWTRRSPEPRSIENPQVPISSGAIMAFLGLEGTNSAGETVTIDSALGVPAVWAAVNFIAGTLAGLPLNLYRRNGSDRTRVRGALGALLHDAVNDEMTSFAWRKFLFEQALTHGRGATFIERNARGQVMNFWPLDTKLLKVRRVNGRKFYEYRDSKRTVVYQPNEVIDISMMIDSDGLTARSPIYANREMIGLAQASTKYGGRFFSNGGVPPFAMTGPINTAGGLQRASDQLAEALKKAASEKRAALALPAGHDIKPLGIDPEKMQFVELQRFLVEQVARIYSLPPTFLQDLTHGTFSNTEQQDLHFVKHTLRRWVEQFEQELNLKIFGRGETKRYIEMNVDGLLRGDFKARMEGYGKGIQHGILTPNEARRRENLPDIEGGDLAYMQSATIPLADVNEVPEDPEEDDSDGA